MLGCVELGLDSHVCEVMPGCCHITCIVRSGHDIVAFTKQRPLTNFFQMSVLLWVFVSLVCEDCNYGMIDIDKCGSTKTLSSTSGDSLHDQHPPFLPKQ